MPAPLCLPDAALAAVAQGRPGPEALATLRRSQLSRRLLLLRELARATPEAAGWYEILATAERQAPDPVRAVLAHPVVGAWAARCLADLRAGRTGPAGVDHLAAVTAAAVIASGLDLAVDVPVHDGRLVLPTLGAAELPGAGVARVRGRTIVGGRRTITVPPDASADGPGWLGQRRITARHDDAAITVLVDDLDPHRCGLGLPVTDRLTAAELAGWQAQFAAAWRLLVTRHRPWAGLVAAVLSCVVPVRPDPGARGISATSAEAFGAVAISAPADPTALAVGLVHETQHSVLNAVQQLVDLVDADQRPAYSPWRDDPRPVAGVLHGAFAYLGVTDFWRTERMVGGPIAQFEFARWRAAVTATAEELSAGEQLTPAGRRFVAALWERAMPWLAEPVPSDVDRLAQAANADHRARWRLRNLTVDPAVVATAAAAWAAGRPAPAGPAPVTVRQAGRTLERNARLDLVHRRLRGEPDPAQGRPGSPGSAADRAYVGGDRTAAVAAYRAAVRADPADDAAWAGLALCTGDPTLRDRPELVAAVYRAIVAGAPTGTIVPEPETLAAYLRRP